MLTHSQKAAVSALAIAATLILASCGNSGNSSEPHVHYHLQTTAIFGKGEGLPAQFQRYYADGNWVERGEPTRGQNLRVP